MWRPTNAVNFDDLSLIVPLTDIKWSEDHTFLKISYLRKYHKYRNIISSLFSFEGFNKKKIFCVPLIPEPDKSLRFLHCFVGTNNEAKYSFMPELNITVMCECQQ